MYHLYSYQNSSKICPQVGRDVLGKITNYGCTGVECALIINVGDKDASACIIDSERYCDFL